MNKQQFSERDICTKLIKPALAQAGLDLHMRIREEVPFAKGCIIVRGKLAARGKPKRTDDVLDYLPNLPLTFGHAVHALPAALCEEAR